MRSGCAGLGAGVVIAVALIGVAPAWAQAPPGGQATDTIPLVFEREIFHYPEFERRNPFQPLTGDLDGPRFEELQLLGIIASQDPARSLALLGYLGGERAQAYRLRVGEVVGNLRVMEIQPTRIIVEVEDFGAREQRILELRRVTNPVPQELFRPREPVVPPVDTAPPPAGDTLTGPPVDAPPPPPADTIPARTILPGSDQGTQGGQR